MRIAQVAPLYGSVPPKLYGGTERIVSYLTEELVADGHDVTLFASADSLTKARLIPMSERALRLGSKNLIDPLASHIRMIEIVAREAQKFDIIHFHIDYLHFPSSRRQCIPSVTTLHGRLDIPELWPLYSEFRDIDLVSISNSQRKPIPWANWAATIYHGLPKHLLDPTLEAGKYLAFLGRISPEKRVDRAIEIARQAGVPIKIAAKVDPVDQAYFDCTVRGLLDDPLVEFVGEISESQKSEFLGNARALLFPIDWPEPFGVVMIEALACGTPVVAYPKGAVPEIIEDGVSGYLVETIQEGVEAVGNLSKLDRGECRRVFEQRFSARRMCRDYLNVYKRLCGRPAFQESTSAASADSPPARQSEIHAT